MNKVNCQQCGKEFFVSKSRIDKARFCSVSCKTESQKLKVKVKCQECNAEFETIPSDLARGNSKFCSMRCRGKSHSKRFRGSSNPVWKGAKQTVYCIQCNQPFETYLSNLQRGNGKYCSPECQYKAMSGEGSGLWTGGTFELKCEFCGKPFTVRRHRKDLSRFCSNICNVRFNALTHKGENNPHWRGGDSAPYPPEFNNILKRQIKLRDSHKCQWCQAEKYLQVHHIDYDKSNNLESNLITLCRPCHSKTTFGNRDYWQEVLAPLIEHYYLL